jgi:cyclin D5
MGEAAAAEEGCSAGCSFSSSLMCLEDGADLDAAGGSAEGAGDVGRLAAFLYGDAGEDHDQEEYMDHLVSKETSFCCSPSSSSPVFSDAGAEPCPSSTASSDEWFRCARRATVEWIFEVIDRSIQHKHPSLIIFPFL